MSLLLLLLLLKYYPEEQNVESLFLKQKSKKMFQIDLNSDFKEKPDFKSKCWFTLCFSMSKVVNMAEYAWNIASLNKPEI